MSDLKKSTDEFKRTLSIFVETNISSVNPASMGKIEPDELAIADKCMAYSLLVLGPCVIVVLAGLGLRLIWAA